MRYVAPAGPVRFDAAPVNASGADEDVLPARLDDHALAGLEDAVDVGETRAVDVDRQRNGLERPRLPSPGPDRRRWRAWGAASPRRAGARYPPSAPASCRTRARRRGPTRRRPACRPARRTETCRSRPDCPRAAGCRCRPDPPSRAARAGSKGPRSASGRRGGRCPATRPERGPLRAWSRAACRARRPSGSARREPSGLTSTISHCAALAARSNSRSARPRTRSCCRPATRPRRARRSRSW